MSNTKPHLAILGAGPIGLEAALAAVEGGFPFTLYEAGPSVGTTVRAWGHVKTFTPWDLNVSPRMRKALAAAPAGTECPTGRELVARLLDPVAALPAVAPHVRLGTRVVAVGREGLLKHEEIATPERARHRFRLLLEDSTGEESVATADVVLDTTGTWDQPNCLGDGGIPAPGERQAEADIRRHCPDFASEAPDWAGRTILLVGGGHSAQTAIRDLADLAREAPGTRAIWALRGAGSNAGQAGDPLQERARLANAAAALANGASPAVETRRGVVVEAIARTNGRYAVTLRGAGGSERVEADRILSLTGYVGDHTLYRQLQVHECYATCGPMKLSAALLGASSSDCLDQASHGAETLKNPEPGFFILGIKSYGRNTSFLMRTGWDQVSEVFGLLQL